MAGKPHDSLASLRRFSEPALSILISLADGPKHGYAMTQDIGVISGATARSRQGGSDKAGRGMNKADLLPLYPRAWRERYGDEFLAVGGDRRLGPGVRPRPSRISRRSSEPTGRDVSAVAPGEPGRS